MRRWLALAVAFTVGAQAGEIAKAGLPPEARQVLARIESGAPHPERRDGAVFHNREHRLPARPSGYYREYTVRTPGVSGRGARRIVAGEQGERYYTADHYRTFLRIRE